MRYKLSESPRLAHATAMPAFRRREALIVLGMHRSGTSALTRVLSLCGAALPRNLMPANDESNKLGHWEPARIVEIHDRFLSAIGSGWDDISALDPAVFSSEIAQTYKRRLIDAASDDYGGSRLFVLKDPRASRLMPLWRQVLDALDVAPRIVIAIRNPLEVAKSLAQRDGWDEYYAYVSWMRHLLSAERDTRGMPRCFVSYDRLLDDWRSVVGCVRRELWPADECSPIDEETIDAFLQRDMRHHRGSASDLFDRVDIADCVKQTYRLFSAAAESGRIDLAALDALNGALDSVESEFRTIIVPGERQRLTAAATRPRSPAERDVLYALTLAELGRVRLSGERLERRLQEALAAHHREVSRLTAEWQRQSDEMAATHKRETAAMTDEWGRRLEAMEISRDRQAQRALDLDRGLERMLVSLTRETERVRQLESSLDAILKSRSWRLMAPYRAMGRGLKRLRSGAGATSR